MPYTPPATRITSPALSPSRPPISFCSFKKKNDLDEIANNLILNTIDDATKERDNALKEVKDILSTSPQLSTSPRRKSAPESYSRRPSLKVELPLSLAHEMPEMPCIIRKKSGEVVKPSLKKSKSEPPTPTAAFPKYVHFNADLEQIKLFNEAQRPQAVSAEVSDDDSDDDDEFDFFSDDEEEDVVEEEPELVISLPNRPIITTMHRSKPVFVESIFLSRDKKVLQGRVMVQNIAFQKSVRVRYTFDFWSTVSEVSASYAEGIPSKDNKNSFDVFIFSIDLIDNSRNPIDGKTMYFAVHYRVDDNDFWDNNDGSNYQVNFKRVTPPSALRKNSHLVSHNNTTTTTPRWSMNRPTKNIDESLGRSPPSVCSPPTSINVTPDTRKKLLGRYDIGISLSAAQNTTPRSFDFTRPIQVPCFTSQVSYNNENFQAFFPNNYIDGMPGTSDLSMPPPSSFEPKRNSNPISIPSSRPAIGSRSYYDLINQYCFYSSSPPVLASS